MNVSLKLNDWDRLEGLEAGAAADGALADFTSLATLICGAPTAVVTLVGVKRQCFHSRLGREVPAIQRALEFCAQLGLLTTPVMVVDTALDSRFAGSSPVRSDREVRFCASFPLTGLHGDALGTLTVVDYVPRSLDENQCEALQILSRQVSRCVNLAHERARTVVHPSDGGARFSQQELTAPLMTRSLDHGEVFRTEQVPTQAVELRSANGGETILLVEDEPAVRRAAKMLLERAGYRVLVAGDGVEALEIFQEKCSEIDLLLSDVVMPRMGGFEAAKKISEIKAVPVLFCSGYTAGALQADHQIPAGVQILQKPYSPAVLRSTVRALLDARKGAEQF